MRSIFIPAALVLALTAGTWLEQRREEMLPVRYFHVTVTVPEELRTALRRHRINGYGALMKAAAAAIIATAIVAANWRGCDAALGVPSRVINTFWSDRYKINQNI